MGIINHDFCESISIGANAYELLGLSVSGTSEKVNQDSFGFFSDGERIIIVIADGLGSAPMSHIGSRCMVESVFEVMSQSDIDDIWAHISETWRSNLQGDLGQYDTTCKFICIDAGNVTMGSIGDGWLGFEGTGGYHELENNSIFTNMTASICSDDVVGKAVVVDFDTDEFIAAGISTDGISEDMVRESRCEFIHDFGKASVDDIRAICNEIRSVMFNWPVESNKDDKTIVLIRKVE